MSGPVEARRPNSNSPADLCDRPSAVLKSNVPTGSCVHRFCTPTNIKPVPYKGKPRILCREELLHRIFIYIEKQTK